MHLMPAWKTIESDGPQNGQITVLGRIRGADGSLVQQSSIQSVQIRVYDKSTESKTHESTPTVSNVVFDSLQNDDRWNDSEGYNFRSEVPASAFPDGDTTYRIQVKFTASDGAIFWSDPVDHTTTTMIGEGS